MAKNYKTVVFYENKDPYAPEVTHIAIQTGASSPSVVNTYKKGEVPENLTNLPQELTLISLVNAKELFDFRKKPKLEDRIK